MVVDSCAIRSMHFFDVCLTIPEALSMIRGEHLIVPFNYNSLVIEKNSTENLKRQIINSIVEFKEIGVNITSITSDNIPSQVLAFAPWPKYSINNSSIETDINSKRLLNSACTAHTVNLVAKSIESTRDPQFLQNVYSSFLKAASLLSNYNECGLEKPPKSIKTR